MSEVCRLLFVYGTLRRDNAHPMARYLESVSRLLGQATTVGRLYDFGWHPGLVVASNGDERVHGHLVEMLDPETVLARLDAYEAEPPGFQRRVTAITDQHGQGFEAWVYWYTGPLGSATWLVHGDYGVQSAMTTDASRTQA
jgi:gamma-glutamylcyclotransferase (GGCT)/AIG2-like uncharacterized protein YtfP